MLIEQFQPAPLLQPYIRHYLVIACAQESVNRILPGNGLTLVFRYQGDVGELGGTQPGLLPRNMLSGMQKSARLIRYAPGSGNVLVLFREAGAAAFFRQPLHELFGTTASLDHLITPTAADHLSEQLATAGSNSERIRVVERLLTSRLQSPVTDPLVAEALGRIQATEGALKIKALAAALYISQDAFEKRFRKTVGASPKQYSALVRMNALVSRGNKDRTFTDIALDAGYADQPHFNKDFRTFTGQSPTDFFLAPPRW
ncbi:helix-turn-helix domain-containing protein [Taibaiella chishuiensis]|uniref:Helix-turn-helix protein n=1 Tax=Taibaiella chishuiensis TaxID=1434707 RepID=A0A2P8DDN9_9BACT|nr:helix-turn-helix domain-containing protein [Taibaiella chishuiensis]PSK95322.1 helix-turn-helix protein [Taibaiella chishuiensis]